MVYHLKKNDRIALDSVRIVDCVLTTVSFLIFAFDGVEERKTAVERVVGLANDTLENAERELGEKEKVLNDLNEEEKNDWRDLRNELRKDKNELNERRDRWEIEVYEWGKSLEKKKK
ncbi:9746_t:CDS:2 [Funneliformis geosporum]|uniref:9746_t:CDS:1 n=1 Tax=Funneliformis geosporum TaxID=1117311 RepID=A0A9W4SCV7_9GLOM|nr:9746_t:CDS:2 [Funneliformis geosporum]